MSSNFGVRIGLPLLLLCLAGVGAWYAVPWLTGWNTNPSPAGPEEEVKTPPHKGADPAAHTTTPVVPAASLIAPITWA